MKNIHSVISHKKTVLLLLVFVCMIVTLVSVGVLIHAAQDEVEYIYFDLAAGNVSITGNAYTGYAYQKNGEADFVLTEIKGSLQKNQEYYVYQSVGGASAPDGYFVVNADDSKTFTLPQRTPISIDGKMWHEYVTNNTDVNGVITAWKTYSNRTATKNKIAVEGTMDCSITLDHVFSDFITPNTTGRANGGLSFNPSNTSKLTVNLIGENRFGNIFYGTTNDNQRLIFDAKIPTASITVGNLKENSNQNRWCSAIGASDSGRENAKGIVIQGGTIWAGTTKQDDCTAIGAGGNGIGVITITSNSTVTAVTSSSGTAIGGGIGKQAKGGQAEVYITGGTVYAYNFSCASDGYSNQKVPYIPSAAIGGGSSAQATCNESIVEITGGRVYAQSVGGTAIGGGSSADNNGGSSTITIGGNAYVEAKSVAGTINGAAVPAGVAIGGGTGGKASAKNGGDVQLTIQDNATLVAGSIGGGKTLSNSGKIGAATVKITGGTIQGQIIMAKGASKSCSFNMSNGIIDNSQREDTFIFLEQNGGAIYMDDPEGIAKLSGGKISNCSAINGGALYMTAGEFQLSGKGEITKCSATENGGAVYMGGGTLKMSGGTMSLNCAINGGGAYLANGEMFVEGGEVKSNTAMQDGGAAYLGGGTLTMSGGTMFLNCAINGGGASVANGSVVVKGGTVSQNQATQNGGAFFITNGDYMMTAGTITLNKATNGDGGAIYVSSSQNDTNITVRSGEISENSAGKSGGALGVLGQNNVRLTIIIGSNTNHYEENNHFHVCADDTSSDESCPIMKNNSSVTSGGGIYLSGSFDVTMNMYCLEEEKNHVGGGVSPSNFMKVEGGTLNISTLGSENEETFGNIVIHSSIHVTGGKILISGSGSNPLFKEPVTVDVDTKTEAEFTDNRKGGNARTIQYFENFEKEDGTISGQYVMLDALNTETHVVRANMYNHPGYAMKHWVLMEKTQDGKHVPTQYTYTADDKIENNPNALIFYAKWVSVGYTIVFTPGVDNYQGSMGPQDFLYSDSKKLSKNAFINVGYVFLYWKNQDDNQKIYTDEQVVSGLSNVHGTIITLVAVWDICDHNDISRYTLTNTQSSATRQCHCLGYSETASLFELVTVYKENTEQGRSVEYDRTSLNGKYPSTIWDFSVYYSGTSNGGVVLDRVSNAPINAGNYTAIVDIKDGVSISVSIIIDRAKRTQSPTLPQYTTTTVDEKNTPENKADDINIILVQDPKDETGIILEYQFSWYVGTKLEKSNWIKWNEDSPPEQKLEVTYTNYYVDVRYAQDDNYYASEIVRGTSIIVWTGNVTFKFDSGDGLTHSPVTTEDKTEGITVTLTPLEGYYIHNVQIKVNDIPNYTLPQMDHTKKQSDSWVVWIHSISKATSAVTIEVLFLGAEKLVVVDSFAQKDEVFDRIDSKRVENVTISRDSAYTVGFHVENYKHYQSPGISFSTAIPVGSTVIMIDHADGSYWGYTALADVTSISLNEFIRLGTLNDRFSAENREEFDLQFIVDFSRCENVPTGNLIVTSFMATPVQPTGLQTVPNMPNTDHAISTVAFSNLLQFSLNRTDSENNGMLSQSVLYNFATASGENIGLSKWDKIRGILLVEPVDLSVLPADARLQVQIGNSTDIYSLINGKFIVALPSVGSESATLMLLSDMLPNENQSFVFRIQLYASATKVKNTPNNAVPNVAPVEITYTVNKVVKAAINAKINGELPRYDGSNISPLEFTVEVRNLPQNSTVRAVLHRKMDNQGYTATTQTLEDLKIVDNACECVLSFDSFKDEMHQQSNSLTLMLSVEIVDANGKVIDSVPLYFVLINARKTGS